MLIHCDTTQLPVIHEAMVTVDPVAFPALGFPLTSSKCEIRSFSMLKEIHFVSMQPHQLTRDHQHIDLSDL
jgi:hypothetical protein